MNWSSITDRRKLYSDLYRAERAKLTPNCGRLSGRQVAYAKGRAGMAFRKLEDAVTVREP